MRLTPIILSAIGLWGLIYPETLLDETSGGGRWVFATILALGLFALWRAGRRNKR
ncbi:MAG: Hypothetical protein BHV28_08750 [Candidatus Tokpelaia hoelldobleri]|uniref:Uncharacterized protein n=1 Tax=Candidatus Tokpelaia hoelldobleri TaxID=1902579 RepID=A0A1U9JUM1_9HYPH|nr:MAG: Hypothetical protein BHV28_08750 [Candidatus Tokpelaia hoelldoblerii]